MKGLHFIFNQNIYRGYFLKATSFLEWYRVPTTNILVVKLHAIWVSLHVLKASWSNSVEQSDLGPHWSTLISSTLTLVNNVSKYMLQKQIFDGALRVNNKCKSFLSELVDFTNC